MIVKIPLNGLPSEAWSRQFNKSSAGSSLKPPAACVGALVSFEIRYGDRSAEDLHASEIPSHIASTNHWYTTVHLPAIQAEEEQKRQEADELSQMHARISEKLRAR